LAKSYKDSDRVIEVLKNVSLDIKEADLICITGRSGCGKSTLLHILGLLDNPDKGKLVFEGKEVTSSSKEAPAIRNKDLGFVFQFHYLIEDLSAEENVALPMIIKGSTRPEAIRKARQLLTRFGLADRATHYSNQLSGGEQQRVSLARAMINEPRIILADEPTGNLDPQKSSEIWEVIVNLNKELGQSFVIITHDKEQARLARQTYELDNGVLDLISG